MTRSVACLWLVVLAGACGGTPRSAPTPAPPIQQAAPDDSASSLPTVELPATVAALFAEPQNMVRDARFHYAIVQRRSLRYTPDGPEQIGKDLGPLDEPLRYPVAEDSERPRVAAFDSDLRLLVYLDREDAQPVVVTRAKLKDAPAEVTTDPPKGFVTLRAGAWVDIEQRRAEALRVRLVGSEHPRLRLPRHHRARPG